MWFKFGGPMSYKIGGHMPYGPGPDFCSKPLWVERLEKWQKPNLVEGPGQGVWYGRSMRIPEVQCLLQYAPVHKARCLAHRT